MSGVQSIEASLTQIAEALTRLADAAERAVGSSPADPESHFWQHTPQDQP